MQKSNAYHPFFQLIFLIMMAIIGALVFTVIGLLLYFFLSTNGIDLKSLAGGDMNNMDIGFIRALQISSSFGMFIAGPIAFAYLIETKPSHYFYFDNPLRGVLLLLVFAIMLFSIPLFEWITLINQKMSLPDALKNIEIWMKQSEDQADLITKKMLIMKDYGDLAINILMIAIIPAIGEELFFRGGMQNVFGQWFKNHHVAIWVTAIIFSSIHMQFYGFLPRMLLGALFGYVLVYGKSIWLAILGHFLNNGSAVIMAYIYQKQGKSLDSLDNTASFNSINYLISAIITLVLLIIFFKQTKEKTKK
ncbi:CPBP family intramembrane metalloprotease [Pedobacter sp. SD-b]|uniref:CPBP family intramembrane metalloprotease n=1 Tax=Pedobacter segetis TaxID=2793069 RepID=A0ABS1BKB2_9SPHI|nr:CPBP family intramembrane glutamic endopeptidase [Pedobacter segetis]MBK0383217.1 CPBP family intramembrane metalloprotease [Pedobacter segetis]